MLAREFFNRYADLIPDYEGFLNSLKLKIPTCIRINTLLAEPEDITRKLQAQGVHLMPTVLGREFWEAPDLDSPGRHPLYCMGAIYPQALSSGIPALVLDPKPGELVLDLCASPGSKTTQMAAMMWNQGRIVANEPAVHRHPALVANLRRLGVANTVVTGYPGQSFPMRLRFHRILVDAPCSGEGNARMGPGGELLGTGPRRGDLHRVQTQLLLRAFDLLEEDGVLVYSTCSLDPMENEAVVDQLLRSREAKVLPIPLDIPHDPGVTSWSGRLMAEELAHAWRIYPHRLKTVGFFLAKISRR